MHYTLHPIATLSIKYNVGYCCTLKRVVTPRSSIMSTSPKGERQTPDRSRSERTGHTAYTTRNDTRRKRKRMRRTRSSKHSPCHHEQDCRSWNRSASQSLYVIEKQQHVRDPKANDRTNRSAITLLACECCSGQNNTQFAVPTWIACSRKVDRHTYFVKLRMPNKHAK